MADWLKVNHALIRSPKVTAMARVLKCHRMAALGVAVSWLVWIDEQSTDGRTNLTKKELDEAIGYRGGADALIAIGWAALDDGGQVVALDFGKHCGVSAKLRAEHARANSLYKLRRKKRGDKKISPEKNRENAKAFSSADGGYADAAPTAEREYENMTEEERDALRLEIIRQAMELAED
jgi:hypothetical protein